MIKFKRVEISNFVCFDNIVIEPSTDPNKRLTVVRADNGSGKTTLLRAIRWGMYGEKGLPSPSADFSMHPAWWSPDDGGIDTVVSIEFETDGSDRFSNDSGTKNKLYMLRRSVTTIGKKADSPKDPDFRRIEEVTQLMIQEDNGLWQPHTAGIDLVIDQLLPWSLRDFFVMDADEVTDFVGGVNDAKILHRKDIIAKTTAAVNGLLGIDIFKLTKDRVVKIGRDFGKQAAVAVGDATLFNLQSELDERRAERDELKKHIDQQSIDRDDLEDDLQEREAELEIELKGIGAAEELSPRLSNSRALKSKLLEKRSSIVSQLAGQIEATELLSNLTYPYVFDTYNLLKPLYDSGRIPVKHLYYVKSLLAEGKCVCGQDISQDNKYRNEILELISQSTEEEERANYLNHIFDATRSLIEFAPDNIWIGQCDNLKKELVDCDSQLSDLLSEITDIENKLDKINEEKIQILRNEKSSLKSRIEDTNRNLAGSEARLHNLDITIESLAKQVGQRIRGELAAKDKREAESIAKVIVQVLDKSYNTIQNEQVTQLSKRMNDLFSQMINNVTIQDIEFKPDKADVRMIDKVGIQSVDGRPDDYEIFALNHRGRSMSPITMNGASRRVLALSFVLALCVESRTYAPLIADSLLNFMAGTVRRNTLLITAQTSLQPILLLTTADLEAQPEMDIVYEHAGATYTLTAQWNAISSGSGGDVLRRKDQRLVSLICSCSPRNYCDICERKGWADLPGWHKRNTKGRLE